eukprot:2744370-Amphidinium_carterae.1
MIPDYTAQAFSLEAADVQVPPEVASMFGEAPESGDAAGATPDILSVTGGLPAATIPTKQSGKRNSQCALFVQLPLSPLRAVFGALSWAVSAIHSRSNPEAALGAGSADTMHAVPSCGGKVPQHQRGN